MINMGPLQLGILHDSLGARAVGVEELCAGSQASAPTSLLKVQCHANI